MPVAHPCRMTMPTLVTPALIPTASAPRPAVAPRASLATGKAAALELLLSAWLEGTDADVWRRIVHENAVLHHPSGTLTSPSRIVAKLAAVRALVKRFDVELLHFGEPELSQQSFHTAVVRGHARTPAAVEARPGFELTVTLAFEAGRVCAAWVNYHSHQASPQAASEASRDWPRGWRLTPRESSVARLAVRGLRDKQIAAALGLETSSVTTYLRRVLRKAQVSARWQLPLKSGVVSIG